MDCTMFIQTIAPNTQSARNNGLTRASEQNFRIKIAGNLKLLYSQINQYCDHNNVLHTLIISEEICYSCRLLSIVRALKLTLIWTGHVVRMGQTSNAHRILMEKSLENIRLQDEKLMGE